MSTEAATRASEILLGNEAIARGLLAGGADVVTGYPGTPSSEILEAVLREKKRHALGLYAEWSVNERVAYEVAYAAAVAGKRAAVTMKQVGLNVAADPFFSSAYTGVVGGLVVVSADDPGPHSSQTEQDSRALAALAKVPVLDPDGPAEALEMARAAFELSHEVRLPVLLRPTHRVCHALGAVPCDAPAPPPPSRATFEAEVSRWAATPRHRYVLHKELNQKLARLAASPWNERWNHVSPGTGELGIIACGVEHAILRDVLAEEGLEGACSILKVGMPHPLPRDLLLRFIADHSEVLVLEDPGPTIESFVSATGKVRGRLDGTVPAEGELTPDIVHRLVLAFLGRPVRERAFAAPLARAVASLELAARKPSLCPGCAHRDAFFAIRSAMRKAISASDIGCYTLGVNLGAVDTCLSMGASISMATGFYRALQLDGQKRQVVATIGDSTFFHAGLSALANAVYTGARFVLVILDNAVTAMTGMQPVPHTGVLSDGSKGVALDIEKAVLGCGVRWVRKADPSKLDAFVALVKEAARQADAPSGSVAVVIAEHPCIVNDPRALPKKPVHVDEERCNGCSFCLDKFECRGLVRTGDGQKVEIDATVCVECGKCIEACPRDAIVPSARAAGGPAP